MSTVLELMEKRKKAWETAKAFLDSRRGSDGLISAEDNATYERMEADVVALGKEIERLQRQAAIDREEQLAILYHKQKKYEDAEKIWEHRVLKGVTDIQTALINMLEIALLEKCNDNAEFFADMYKTITRQFCFPEWMRYNAHLLLAIDKKNKDECLSILKKMLPAMKKEWNVQDCQLYRNAKDSESTLFSSRLADTLCDELATKEEYAFVRDCIEFRELMAEMRS